MKVEELRLEATQSTPEVIFSKNGKMSIKGRSFVENPKRFYKPLVDWCKDVNVQHVDLSFELDYMNTSTSKNLLYLFNALEENSKVSYITVQWCYEADDEEMLELGEIYSAACPRICFEMHELELVEA